MALLFHLCILIARFENHAGIGLQLGLSEAERNLSHPDNLLGWMLAGWLQSVWLVSSNSPPNSAHRGPCRLPDSARLRRLRRALP